jgi:shikimate kinase
MSRSKKVYIIGFMGSGKTTAGMKLASSLGWSFVDLDKKIEEHTGLKIPEIFSMYGEDHFRTVESEVLRTLAPEKNTVISTGGGTPCFGNNMEFMLANGLTIYLKLTPDQLVSRLNSSSDDRPLIRNLTGEDLFQFIEEKLLFRSEWYEKSHQAVDGFDLDISKLILFVKSYTGFTY